MAISDADYYIKKQTEKEFKTSGNRSTGRITDICRCKQQKKGKISSTKLVEEKIEFQTTEKNVGKSFDDRLVLVLLLLARFVVVMQSTLERRVLLRPLMPVLVSEKNLVLFVHSVDTQLNTRTSLSILLLLCNGMQSAVEKRNKKRR